MYLRVIAVHGFDQFCCSTFLEMFNFVIETYLVGNSLICELLFMKRSTFLGGGGVNCLNSTIEESDNATKIV